MKCLRVVWRPDTVSSGVASDMVVRRDRDTNSPPPPLFPYSEYAAGFTSFSGGMGSAMVQPPHAFEGLGLDGVRGMGPYGVVLGVEDAEEEERRREQEEKEREKERERRKKGQGLEWREVGCCQGWVGLFV